MIAVSKATQQVYLLEGSIVRNSGAWRASRVAELQEDGSWGEAIYPGVFPEDGYKFTGVPAAAEPVDSITVSYRPELVKPWTAKLTGLGSHTATLADAATPYEAIVTAAKNRGCEIYHPDAARFGQS